MPGIYVLLGNFKTVSIKSGETFKKSIVKILTKVFIFDSSKLYQIALWLPSLKSCELRVQMRYTRWVRLIIYIKIHVESKVFKVFPLPFFIHIYINVFF